MPPAELLAADEYLALPDAAVPCGARHLPTLTLTLTLTLSLTLTLTLTLTLNPNPNPNPNQVLAISLTYENMGEGGALPGGTFSEGGWDGTVLAI